MLRSGGIRGANLSPEALQQTLEELPELRPLLGNWMRQQSRVNRAIAQVGPLPPRA